MATIISNAQTAYGLADGENIVVTTSGVLSSTNGAALSSVFNNHSIRISGTISGDTGIALTSVGLSLSIINLSATGSVFAASTGISAGGERVQITNAGSIMSEGTAILIGSIAGGSEARIDNAGLISGGVGIIVSADENTLYSDVTLVNHGMIMAQSSSGLAFDNQHADGIDSITNFGTIYGVISTGTSSDFVLNRGSITGEISTGDGDDLVINIDSDDRANTIQLGSGADIVYMGAAEEVIYGAQGYDIVSYRDSSGVRVNLADLTQNTREAARDYYLEVEQISGSQYYGDTLIGNDFNNAFFGDAGNDVLSGGKGNDTLMGGTNADRLTGGLGNDTFSFSLGEMGRDIISDFSNVAGNNDRIEFEGLSLPEGQIVSGLFRARGDNVAQDGNDIFIFRTTDTTLWYDADGNGTEAAVMLADLQASATMTFQDIYILPV